MNLFSNKEKAQLKISYIIEIKGTKIHDLIFLIKFHKEMLMIDQIKEIFKTENEEFETKIIERFK